MTGDTMRDLLQPLIGKSGSISMLVSRIGQVAFPTAQDKKLTGVQVRPDGLIRLERETGWTVTRVPPGFVKIVDGFRRLRGAREVAHLVYSDGLVAVSVFIEPIGAASHPIGISRQGGINVVIRQQDDNLVTVLGEVPVATVRQIAHSVTRR